jgi:hypothetical protein
VGRVDLEMSKANRLAAVVFLVVSGVATSAWSDPSRADDRYGYVFKDDVLAADRSVLTAVPIRVAEHPRGGVLLRPRVQFVTEMLKSVEAL